MLRTVLTVVTLSLPLSAHALTQGMGCQESVTSNGAGLVSGIGVGNHIAENFVVAQQGAISVLTIRGIWFDVVSAQDCPPPAGTSFRIAYYSAPAPHTAPATIKAGPFDIVPTHTSVGTFVHVPTMASVTEWQLEFPHPPFTVAAGETLWVEVHRASPPPCVFSWSKAVPDDGDLRICARFAGQWYPMLDTLFEGNLALCVDVPTLDLDFDMGSTYCPQSVPHSSGGAAILQGRGTDFVFANATTILLSGVPQNRFAVLLASRSTGFTPTPGGSQGDLCLGGTVGSFADQVQFAPNPISSASRIEFRPDLGALPAPLATAVQPGETLHFQAWYRDENPAPTTNFSRALSITFQ